MTGESAEMQAVEKKPMAIESVIGLVAILLAVIGLVAILMININAANVIKDVGFWTGMSYRAVTAYMWLLIAGLAGGGYGLYKKRD